MLAVFCGLNLVVQALWISYAPILSAAQAYYGVDGFAVGMLSMVFMLAFLPFSLRASWLIDARGMLVAVGLGGVLMTGGAAVRAFAGPDYGLAFAGTIAIAVTQPLFLNAWTTLPARWFPERERASAIGLITLANLVGTAVGIILAPAWVAAAGPAGIAGFQQALAAASDVATVLFLLVHRDRPDRRSDASSAHEVRALELSGLRAALRTRGFLAFLAVMFVGMGVFNGVSQWIAEIVAPLGLGAEDAGLLGALMLAGGLVGALVLAPISDRTCRRVPFIAASLGGAAVCTLALALAPSAAWAYPACVGLGLCLVPMMPIGMQYATELTPHTHEGASNGLAQLVGQGSVAFVALMWVLRDGDGRFALSLTAAAALLAVTALGFARLREARDVVA